MELDKYYIYAEYLITKGYVPANTAMAELAVKLSNIDKDAITIKDDCMTRETVYGDPDTVQLIDEMVKATELHDKVLVSEGERESAALVHARDSLDN